MLTVLCEGADGMSLRIRESSVSERGLNETAFSVARQILGSVLKRRVSFDALREDRESKVRQTIERKVSRILLRSCGNNLNGSRHTGTPSPLRGGAPNHGGDKER